MDGYRALAIKTGGKIQLRSRKDNDFSHPYPASAQALTVLPNETVIDGEVVALDESGKPPSQTLQNYGSAGAQLQFYVFDVLILPEESEQQRSLAKATYRHLKQNGGPVMRQGSYSFFAKLN